MATPDSSATEPEELDISTFAQRAETRPAPTEQAAAISPLSPQATPVRRTEPIRVEYINEQGVKVQETVESTVPKFNENLQIARLEAQLCGPGVNFSSMSPNRAAWIRDLARAKVQLTKASPEYLRVLSTDVRVLGDLIPHLLVHESLFFRAGATSSGATQSVTCLAPSSAMDRWLAPEDAG